MGFNAMSKETENQDDDAVAATPEDAKSHRLAGWIMFGSFVLLLVVLIGVELVGRP